MTLECSRSGGIGRLLCQGDGAVRHLGFGLARFARELFNDMPIAVAGRKIHLRVDSGRIHAQDVLHVARGFDELAPIDRFEQTQATDAVADRHLVCGFLLVGRVDELIDRHARFLQAVFDPCDRQCQRSAVSLQAAHQFGDERAAYRRLRARHVGDDHDQAFRIALDDVDHRVGPACGEIAVASITAHTKRNAAQVLNQGEAKHDRNRPQLAERERFDFLVGTHETADRVLVDAAVAVRNRIQRDVVHARQSRRCAALQTRQLPAVAFRKMPPCGADLLVDQIQIIEQPFAGGSNPVAALDRVGEERTTVTQYRFVAGQAQQQAVRTLAEKDLVFASEHTSVLFHLIRAEQLGTQWRITFAGTVVDRSTTPYTRGSNIKPSTWRRHENSRGGWGDYASGNL